MSNPIKSLIDYLRSARAELEKVSWPSRQETLRYSLLVVGVSAAMAAFFFALDFGLSKAVDLALNRQPATIQNVPTQPSPSEIENNLEENEPSVQGFDEEGNPVDIQVTPLNDQDQGGITITP